MKNSEKSKLINALCEKCETDMLMIDTSDEEEDDEIQENFNTNMVLLLTHRRSVHLGIPKSNHWTDKVLNNFDDNRFNQMVRLLPSEFSYIHNLNKDDEVFTTTFQKSQIPSELQLKIVLFRLGSSGDGASIRKIASLFCVGDGGTLQNITCRVFTAILRLKSKFLFWPNDAERNAIISATKHELPGCFGYVDGSEIKLAEAPHKNHQLYFSQKRQYSSSMRL